MSTSGVALTVPATAVGHTLVTTRIPALSVTVGGYAVRCASAQLATATDRTAARATLRFRSMVVLRRGGLDSAPDWMRPPPEAMPVRRAPINGAAGRGARPAPYTPRVYTMRRSGLVVAVGLLAACTQVDSTEHCVETRYGKVVNPRMATGLNLTVLTSSTCFTMTEKNYPSTVGGKEMIPAQTQDPITVEGDIAIVYKYDPA